MSLGERKSCGQVPPPSLTALQKLLWDKAGIVRDRPGLEKASGVLNAWQSSLPEPADQASYELSTLVMTGRLLMEAALLREESRGAHFRSDFPAPSTGWQRHIIWHR